MTILPFFFLLATFFFSSSSVADQTLHSRHLLHQPFFPVVTTAPPPLSSQPPSPSPHIHHHHKKTHEKHLFSSLSNPPPPPPPPHTNPFFPSSSSTTSQPPPSPPHHSSLPTFPANISSLLFPPHTTTPSSHHHNNISKIVTITASIISSLSLLSLFAVFIIFLRRTRRHSSSPQSDSLHLFNTTPSDTSLKKQPPKYTSSNTSSEFLYLGTLVNSRLDQQQQKSPISVTTGVLELPPPPLTSSSPSSSSYHKLDSPELRPLPPLPKLFTPTFKSTEQLNPKDEFENDDEFFSPRGSSGRKQLSDSLINDSCSPTKSQSPPLSLNSLNDSVSKQPGPIRPPPPPPPPLKELKEEESLKLKLKPLHWDKVRASSSRVTVWDQIKSNSFQLNEEMIETLFKANDPRRETEGGVVVKENQFLLDPRKSHNIAILLRALNVTVDEVCEALVEGNSDTLGPELLECLLKMAPTKEEQEKLKELKDDDDEESPSLGPAEKCLKALLNIPYAFKRIDAMLYIVNFESEIEYLKRSFDTLKAACDELKNTRMFLKLLEAVLKTGNRMNTGTNRGDAHAFKLDTLLKLVDIKGTDGKTTLLHFVVQEIIKSEGARVSSSSPTQQSAFQVVSTLSSQMINVKKAAAMDSNSLSNETSEISIGITKVKEVIGEVKEETGFLESMKLFLNKGEKEIIEIQSYERDVLKMVKEVTEYFQGNSEANNNPFQIFIVVRDFLMILDQVCKEVGRVNERTTVYGSVPRHVFPVVNSNNSEMSHSGSLEEEDSF